MQSKTNLQDRNIVVNRGQVSHRMDRHTFCPTTFWIAILFVLFIATIGPLLAQSIVGSIGGVVTDTTGAVVADVTVSVSNEATHVTRARSTGSDGSYTVAGLPPGSYRISVQAKGFKTSVVDNVKVIAGVGTRENALLQLGRAKQTVTVNAGTQTLQTDSGEVRSEITSEQLSNFPVPASGNYESALILVPGISPPLNSGSFAANPTRGLFFSTNGSFGVSNNIHIDGAPTVNPYLPNVAAYSPGLEAIASVTAVTNTYNAQDGLAGGPASIYMSKPAPINFMGLRMNVIPVTLSLRSRFFCQKALHEIQKMSRIPSEVLLVARSLKTECFSSSDMMVGHKPRHLLS